MVATATLGAIIVNALVLDGAYTIQECTDIGFLLGGVMSTLVWLADNVDEAIGGSALLLVWLLLFPAAFAMHADGWIAVTISLVSLVVISVASIVAYECTVPLLDKALAAIQKQMET